MRSLCCLLTFFILSAAAEGPVRIGALYSLTGFGADGGKSELDSVRLAQEVINAGGGIAGRPVELVVEDNQSNLASTVAAIKKFSTVDNVLSIVGPNWVEFTEVAAPTAAKLETPLIASSGSSPSAFVEGTYAFSLWPPVTEATKPISEYIVAKKLRRLAVVLSDNSYYHGLLEAVKQQVAGHGIELVLVEQSHPGQSDFRSILLRIKTSKVEALLTLLQEGGELAALLKQKRDLAIDLPTLSSNITFDREIKANPHVAEGVLYIEYVVPGGPKFRDEFVKRWGYEPGLASAKAYDSLFLIKEAAEKCGVSRAEVRRCLSDMNYEGRSGKIVFNPNGIIRSSERPTSLHTVRDGKFVSLP